MAELAKRCPALHPMAEQNVMLSLGPLNFCEEGNLCSEPGVYSFKATINGKNYAPHYLKGILSCHSPHLFIVSPIGKCPIFALEDIEIVFIPHKSDLSWVTELQLLESSFPI